MMQKFFGCFRQSNPTTKGTKTIFIDKVKGNIRLWATEFPDTPVLICALHAVRAFKSRLNVLALLIERQHDILSHFATILYSYTGEDLQKAKDEC